MSDIEMPVASIGHMNIAIWSMGVTNLINFYAGRKNIHNYRIVKRDKARAKLLTPHKLVIGRAREQIALHSNDSPFVTFHCPHEMTLRVVWEKLSMDNVNVFAGINDHKFAELRL